MTEEELKKAIARIIGDRELPIWFAISYTTSDTLPACNCLAMHFQCPFAPMPRGTGNAFGMLAVGEIIQVCPVE